MRPLIGYLNHSDPAASPAPHTPRIRTHHAPLSHAAGMAAAGALGPRAPARIRTHAPHTAAVPRPRVRCGGCGSADADRPPPARPPVLRMASQDGRTPLHIASQKSHASAVDRLIAARADVESTTKVLLACESVLESSHALTHLITRPSLMLERVEMRTRALTLDLPLLPPSDGDPGSLSFVLSPPPLTFSS